MENPKINISLDKAPPITCVECGAYTFREVLFLRKISRFVTGTNQDSVLPIPTFACSKCHAINPEFQPKDI